MSIKKVLTAVIAVVGGVFAAQAAQFTLHNAQSPSDWFEPSNYTDGWGGATVSTSAPKTGDIIVFDLDGSYKLDLSDERLIEFVNSGIKFHPQLGSKLEVYVPDGQEVGFDAQLLGQWDGATPNSGTMVKTGGGILRLTHGGGDGHCATPGAAPGLPVEFVGAHYLTNIEVADGEIRLPKGNAALIYVGGVTVKNGARFRLNDGNTTCMNYLVVEEGGTLIQPCDKGFEIYPYTLHQTEVETKISGSIVADGCKVGIPLSVVADTKEFKYYRFTVTAGGGNSSWVGICFQALQLYDANGNMQNAGLTVAEGAWTASGFANGSEADRLYLINSVTPKAGEVAFDASMVGKYWRKRGGMAANNDLDNFDILFNTSEFGVWGRFICGWVSNSNGDKLGLAANPLSIVMHLADDAKPIASFDVVGAWDASISPKYFTLEGSPDGTNWTRVYSNLNGSGSPYCNEKEYVWLSDGTDAKQHAAHTKFATSASSVTTWNRYFDYYRVTITEYNHVNKGQIGMREIALFDEDGKQVNAGLKIAAGSTKEARQPRNDGQWYFYTVAVDPAPGEYAFSSLMSGQNFMIYADSKDSTVDDAFAKNLDVLFDGNINSIGNHNHLWDEPVTAAKPFSIVMRLPKGSKPVASFDICSDYTKFTGPKRVKLEGSIDGTNWTTVYSNLEDESGWATAPGRGVWYSDAGTIWQDGWEYGVGGNNAAIESDLIAYPKSGGFVLSVNHPEANETFSTLTGAGAVNGGSITFAETATLDTLALGAGTAGTIGNAAFNSAVIDLIYGGEDSITYSMPTFTDCTGTEAFGGYTVNGATIDNTKFTLDTSVAGKITLTKVIPEDGLTYETAFKSIAKYNAAIDGGTFAGKDIYLVFDGVTFEEGKDYSLKGQTLYQNNAPEVAQAMPHIFFLNCKFEGGAKGKMSGDGSALDPAAGNRKEIALDCVKELRVEGCNFAAYTGDSYVIDVMPFNWFDCGECGITIVGNTFAAGAGKRCPISVKNKKLNPPAFVLIQGNTFNGDSSNGYSETKTPVLCFADQSGSTTTFGGANFPITIKENTYACDEYAVLSGVFVESSKEVVFVGKDEAFTWSYDEAGDFWTSSPVKFPSDPNAVKPADPVVPGEEDPTPYDSKEAAEKAAESMEIGVPQAVVEAGVDQAAYKALFVKSVVEKDGKYYVTAELAPTVVEEIEGDIEAAQTTVLAKPGEATTLAVKPGLYYQVKAQQTLEALLGVEDNLQMATGETVEVPAISGDSGFYQFRVDVKKDAVK